MISDVLEKISKRSAQEKREYYENLAHSLTISTRAIWSDPDTSEKEKIEQMKCINEIMHQVVKKIRLYRTNDKTLSDEAILNHIENWVSQSKGVAGHVGYSIKKALENHD